MADSTRYKVVINHEEQYSLWPTGRANALGWSDAGKMGNKEDCLRYVEKAWTKNRPRNIRQTIENDLRRRP